METPVRREDAAKATSVDYRMPMSPWKVLLHQPRTPGLWIVLALLMGLPTLGWGLAGDDWMQRLVLQGNWPQVDSRGPFLDFFRFIPGTVEGNASLEEIGTLPWWARPVAQHVQHD